MGSTEKGVLADTAATDSARYSQMLNANVEHAPNRQ